METTDCKENNKICSRRILASLIDIVIILLFDIVLALPAGMALVNNLVSKTGSSAVALFFSSLFSGAFLLGVDLIYLVGMPLYKNGQTVGLRFFDLKIVSFDGNSPRTKQYLIRFLSMLLLAASTLGFALIVEAISIIVSIKHHSCVDELSRTYIIDLKEKENSTNVDTTH